MDRLLLTDCGRFFAHYLDGLLNIGMLEPLQTYQAASEQVEARVEAGVRSWHQALAEGRSFLESVLAMTPRFPACVEELLILGEQRSCLDAVVGDLDGLCACIADEELLLDAAARLLDGYRNRSHAGAICEGCCARDLLKILHRGELEAASEVLLEQEGELFFHQRYLGVKPVRISEPCHSLVFTTLQRALTEAAPTGILQLPAVLGAEDQPAAVEQIGTTRFRVAYGPRSLVLTFGTHLG